MNKKNKIIGVGGAGANIVKSMNPDKMGNMDFVIVNKAGENCDVRLDDKEALKTVIENFYTVFIVAGMGGKTGTLGSCEIAKIAKGMGVITHAVVVLPFAFEGQKRMEAAQKGILELKKHVGNELSIISAEDFVSSEPCMKSLPFSDLFFEINKKVQQRIIGLLT